MNTPYLADTVQVVVMIETFPLHQGQILPGLDVVAQMNEDFSITEDLPFKRRWERIRHQESALVLQEFESWKSPRIPTPSVAFGGQQQSEAQ